MPRNKLIRMCNPMDILRVIERAEFLISKEQTHCSFILKIAKDLHPNDYKNFILVCYISTM